MRGYIVVHMTSRIIIVGAGGHGRVCAEVAAASGLEVMAFCDAAGGLDAVINGIAVVKAGDISAVTGLFNPSEHVLFVAIGDNDARMRLMADAGSSGFSLPALVHPSAVISPTAEIGAGTVIAANSVVNANAHIGKGCILNTACSVDHDNVLEDGVQICPGVRSAGNVHFGEKAFVGTGAIIVPGVKVGREAHIAAGALLISDVADNQRVGRFPSRLEGS